MAHQNVVDVTVLQGIIGRQNCASRIAENVLNALALQALPENLCSRFCHGSQSLILNLYRLRGAGRPRLSGGAKLRFVLPAKTCRASLDWTAEGGCPHAVVAAAIILPRDNLPARLPAPRCGWRVRRGFFL